MFFNYIYLCAYVFCIYCLCSGNVQSYLGVLPLSTKPTESPTSSTLPVSNISSASSGESNVVNSSYIESLFNTDINVTACSDVPSITNLSIGTHDFNISWLPSSDCEQTDIHNYNVTVFFQGVNWEITNSCNLLNEDQVYESHFAIHDTVFSYKDALPYGSYIVYITTNTTTGLSETLKIPFVTKEAPPKGVLFVDVTYDANITQTNYLVTVNITFDPDCFNGEFHDFEILWHGTRPGYPNDDVTDTIIDTRYCFTKYNVKPEYQYEISVKTSNGMYSGMDSTVSNYSGILAPAGPPIYNVSKISGRMKIYTHAVTVVLNINDFNDTFGELRFIAILIAQDSESVNLQRWTIGTWPDFDNETDNGLLFQATPKFWIPFSDSQTAEFTIGTDRYCSGFYCNKPLTPNTTYSIILKVFNKDYYQTTNEIVFTTEIPLKNDIVGIAVMLTIVIPALLMLTVYLIVQFKKRKNSRLKISCSFADISKQGFIEYCDKLENEPDELSRLWNDLRLDSDSLLKDVSAYFSALDENKQKNRYINIFPNDENRVKLKDRDESDNYINASYIKGFTGKKQYIAAQAPLASTCDDFWKMILQENVSIIVMLAKLMEGGRERCYKYFPDKDDEVLMIDSNIEVRCGSQLHLGFFCVRTLHVTTETIERTVQHMQFLEWPDFNVPSSTETVLHFLNSFNSRWDRDNSLALVHCSAGVGRTGTFIATNILIDAIKTDKVTKINVYRTVLELRRQRMRMVQTVNQYLYIHRLLKSFLMNPRESEDGEASTSASIHTTACGLLNEPTENLIADDSNEIAETPF